MFKTKNKYLKCFCSDFYIHYTKKWWQKHWHVEQIGICPALYVYTNQKFVNVKDYKYEDKV